MSIPQQQQKGIIQDTADTSFAKNGILVFRYNVTLRVLNK